MVKRYGDRSEPHLTRSNILCRVEIRIHSRRPRFRNPVRNRAYEDRTHIRGGESEIGLDVSPPRNQPRSCPQQVLAVQEAVQLPDLGDPVSLAPIHQQ